MIALASFAKQKVQLMISEYALSNACLHKVSHPTQYPWAIWPSVAQVPDKDQPASFGMAAVEAVT
jgi:hypothetical protein